MAPKKEQAPEKIPLGRPGNNLKSGIVCEHNSTPQQSTLIILYLLDQLLIDTVGWPC